MVRVFVVVVVLLAYLYTVVSALPIPEHSEARNNIDVAASRIEPPFLRPSR
ncbi:hypothetical protein M378DRAFT_6015 [Amanita muscaria Koide BX008]|uniref:Uncharacterized protein n=1 Tax=Amanita muscaria (strain Koide BX008) TaxID=946122 RepID=A0A0C2TV20_AMAMK|nr:hypothetical protein M378DRAFT_6015 [Amanita muscaria Koide BX008]